MFRAIMVALVGVLSRLRSGFGYALGVTFETIWFPFALLRAALAPQPTASDVEVAQAQGEIQRLTAEAARNIKTESSVSKAPALVAKDIAKAILGGTETPSTEGLPMHVRKFLLTMTPDQAEIIRTTPLAYLDQFLAGKRRIPGLDLDPDDHETEALIERTYRAACGGAKAFAEPAEDDYAIGYQI